MIQDFLRNGRQGNLALDKRRKKVTVTPALEVAERDPSPVNPEMVIELGTNQTGAQTDGSLLAAEEAQGTGTPVEGPKEVRVQVLEKPYTTSYFLPGKLEGRPVQFLVDTGCTTNLLSKQVFDRLPERVRNCLEESGRWYAITLLRYIEVATPSERHKD